MIVLSPQVTMAGSKRLLCPPFSGSEDMAELVSKSKPIHKDTTEKKIRMTWESYIHKATNESLFSV